MRFKPPPDQPKSTSTPPRRLGRAGRRSADGIRGGSDDRRAGGTGCGSGRSPGSGPWRVSPGSRGRPNSERRNSAETAAIGLARPAEGQTRHGTRSGGSARPTRGRPERRLTWLSIRPVPWPKCGMRQARGSGGKERSCLWCRSPGKGARHSTNVPRIGVSGNSPERTHERRSPPAGHECADGGRGEGPRKAEGSISRVRPVKYSASRAWAA